MIKINGSYGEGGGQILRTSVSLSIITGKPVTIYHIRANRKNPGLRNQHLTSVNAARDICSAQVDGNYIGSDKLTFSPGPVSPGKYKFTTNTAGSTTLVLQTILPALITAEAPSDIILEGGTHNTFAPPYDFIEKTFLPVLNQLGPEVSINLERFGFYPAGGGQISVNITPSESLKEINLTSRGEVRKKSSCSIVARLPDSIASRELEVIKKRLKIPIENLHIKEIQNSTGPGNVVMVEINCDHITEIITGFGRKGITAERVAKGVANEAGEYLSTGAVACKHLADQIILPMALAGKGRFITMQPTNHLTTNIAVINEFLDVEISIKKYSDVLWEVEVKQG